MPPFSLEESILSLQVHLTGDTHILVVFFTKIIKKYNGGVSVL